MGVRDVSTNMITTPAGKVTSINFNESIKLDDVVKFYLTTEGDRVKKMTVNGEEFGFIKATFTTVMRGLRKDNRVEHSIKLTFPEQKFDEVDKVWKPLVR